MLVLLHYALEEKLKYLVSIENSEYFQWQINILIESFKFHNLQDDLVVAIADLHDDTVVCDNLANHKHKFNHSNSRSLNPYLNKSYAITLAISKGLVGSNFVVIEPDMVLANPIKPSKSNISFSVDYDFDQGHFYKVGYDFLKKIIGDSWLNVGSVMQFNDVDASFFERVISIGVKIENDFKKINGTTNAPSDKRYADKIAWMILFIEKLKEYSIKGNNEYETNLMDNSANSNLIHYNHGMPPIFNKRMYLHPEISLQGEGPLETLVNNSRTETSEYVKTIVSKILK